MFWTSYIVFAASTAPFWIWILIPGYYNFHLMLMRMGCWWEGGTRLHQWNVSLGDLTEAHISCDKYLLTFGHVPVTEIVMKKKYCPYLKV